ncbi:hypothetical protein R3P38DRAFT_2815716 [Favolaschia claudopus]|uniref:Uncharacterized protein n=1 Tax=Favolaschia claudopus TaxID=2862362 RepID=A0AAV9Z0I2_9AGAR
MAKSNAKKRSRKRVARENRKNLRLWAEGARETILSPHLEAYQAAKDQGRRQERKILKKICREFHARVSWRVQDHEEPVLKDWDANTVEDEELLTEDEAAAKNARMVELDARIRRWFTYRLRKIRKNQHSSRDEDPRKDPYAVLLANLSGVIAPPKALQGYQQFMRESYEEKIAPLVAERWEQEKKDHTRLAERSKEPKAGFRAEVARQVFASLPEDERKAIGERAKQQAAEAKAAYMDSLKATPSQTPAARQKCIDAVADFAGPILQGLHAHTGMHATLIMGGPVPMFGGELRTVHVSYGRNRTVLGLHWPQWDKPRFAEVTKCMTDYLHTAYTPQECAASALNAAPDFSGASYTINAPDDESSSDSSSDSDSSDSGSSDEEEDDESEDSERRPAKKRKISAPTTTATSKTKNKSTSSKAKRASTKKGRSSVVGGVANGGETAASTPATVSDPAPAPSPDPPATDDPAPAPSPDPPATDDNAPAAPGDDNTDDTDDDGPRFDGPYMGYHIPESERQKNIERNKALLLRLKNDVGADLNTLLAELRGEPAAPSSQSTASKARPRARPRAAATPRTGTRNSARLATGSTTAAPTQPVDPPPVSAPSPAAPVVAPSDSPSEPTPDSPAGPTIVPRDGADSDSPTPPSPLPPLSQAAQTAIANTTAPPPPRATRSASAAEAPPYPPHAAPWFRDAYAAMTRIDLGPHFHALVAAWTRMEAASRFEHSESNLSPKLRPKQVGAWIAANRRGTDPLVENPTEYAAQWQQWWDSLQPSWRSRDAEGRWSISATYGGAGREWGPLYRWGVNGVLSILASLYFWGCAVQSNQDLLPLWEAAVVDVVWMLEGMALYYEMFKGKF